MAALLNELTALSNGQLMNNEFVLSTLKELSLNNTYKEVHNNNVNVISRHLDYTTKKGIDVPEQHE